MWRGGLDLAYLFPALSFTGVSLSRPCSVSTSRSSNRTCAINASGSRRKRHGFAHEKLHVRLVIRTRPKWSWSLSSENFLDVAPDTLCFARSH